MALTKRSLRKFKSLYEKYFGEKLSDKEAEKKADYLVNIYRAVYGKFEFQDSDKDKKNDEWCIAFEMASASILLVFEFLVV